MDNLIEKMKAAVAAISLSVHEASQNNPRTAKVLKTLAVMGVWAVAAKFFWGLWSPAWGPGDKAAYAAAVDGISLGNYSPEAGAEFNALCERVFGHSPVAHAVQWFGMIGATAGAAVLTNSVWSIQVV